VARQKGREGLLKLALKIFLELLRSFQPIALRIHVACLLKTNCRYGLSTGASSSAVKTGKIVWSKPAFQRS
jgi:hypothetical protein